MVFDWPEVTSRYAPQLAGLIRHLYLLMEERRVAPLRSSHAFVVVSRASLFARAHALAVMSMCGDMPRINARLFLQELDLDRVNRALKRSRLKIMKTQKSAAYNRPIGLKQSGKRELSRESLSRDSDNDIASPNKHK